MQFDEGADLDTSDVLDARGGGGGGGGFGMGRMAFGGGGVSILGLLVYLFFGGGFDTDGSETSNPSSGSYLDQAAPGQPVTGGDLASQCRTGADANDRDDCATVAVINSIQDYWEQKFQRSGKQYRHAKTVFFSGSTQTGCGAASADVGPFYCPADSQVYIDLSFYNDLRTQFGAAGGTFADAYVLAHEYGHHVQNLLGTSDKVGSATGRDSGSVRLELQADCYAGVWANHATSTPDDGGKPLITDITNDDVQSALDTAEKIGDDYIQTHLAHQNVDESQFTHGSSAEREKWFSTGMRTGDPNRCDTFSTDDLG